MADSTYRVVPAVDKAARLLAELRAEQSLGISELSRRIAASKGTVRDILLTLASHGLVRRDAEGRFRRAAAGTDLPGAATPHLERLCTEFAQTAILGVITEGRLLIAARVEPATDLHMSARIGQRLPLGAGAHGKVLSGGQPIGYDDEEYLAGVRAVAAPVRNDLGQPVAALIVVGLKERLEPRILHRIGDRCAAEADALTVRLGGTTAATQRMG